MLTSQPRRGSGAVEGARRVFSSDRLPGRCRPGDGHHAAGDGHLQIHHFMHFPYDPMTAPPQSTPQRAVSAYIYSLLSTNVRGPLTLQTGWATRTPSSPLSRRNVSTFAVSNAAAATYRPSRRADLWPVGSARRNPEKLSTGDILQAIGPLARLWRRTAAPVAELKPEG